MQAAKSPGFRNGENWRKALEAVVPASFLAETVSPRRFAPYDSG